VPATVVAAEFGISRRNLGRWFKDPRLEFPIPVQINKRLYFKRSELEEWKASRVRLSVREAPSG
jgi:predicted DNA-binding transcriptional regulator AlpA